MAPVKREEVPDYYDVIKTPMDLQTISDGIEKNRYSKKEDFERDVRLVFKNATTYNQKGTIYYKCAIELEEVANKLLSNLKFDHNDTDRDIDTDDVKGAKPEKKIKEN